MNDKNTEKILRHWHDFNLQIIFKSIIVGLFSGLIVILYRVCLNEADILRNKLYSELYTRPIIYIVLWFIALIIFGIIIGILVKKMPMIKGSGIPQVKGFLLRQIKLDWLKELIGKFIGGILSIGLGMSLGREGPSVQLGATTGLGLNKMTKGSNLEEKYLVTAGASAGLAAAFNAPLAGVIFALEELHKSFSPLILTCVMGASIAANFISGQILGVESVFNFNIDKELPLNYYGFIILLGIITAFLGKLFNFLLLKSQKNIDKNKKINKYLKPVIPLIVAGILAFTLPDVLGGGHHLIVQMSHADYILRNLIVLFVIKLIFSALCYGSGSPGGIFLPLLALGAIIGRGYADILITYFHISDGYILNFITLAMAAYFTAVVRAPITGSILITEMTGSFNHLLPLITICLTSYIVTYMINSTAIYDTLLEKMLEKKNGNWFKEADDKKVILEIPINFGSEIEHKMIRDISWPDNCLIVGIRRGEKEIIPSGEYKIYAGDYLVVLVDEKKANILKPTLIALGSAESI